MGGAAAAFAAQAGPRLGFEPRVVRAAGLATVGWAGVLGVASFAGPWRPVTRSVSVANVGAAAGLGLLAIVRRGRPGRIGMAFTAGDVAAFAIHQHRVLRRPDPAAG